MNISSHSVHKTFISDAQDTPLRVPNNNDHERVKCMHKGPRYLIFLLLLPVFLLAGCVSNTYAKFDGDLALIKENVTKTEQISDKLAEICNDQIEDAELYWKAHDSALQNGEMFDPEDNYDEVKATYDELTQQIGLLETVSGSYAPPSTGEDSFDKTAAVYLLYLGDIRQSAEDMRLVFDYYFAMRDALEPFENFSYAENTTGYNDYALMAGQLSQVISQTQQALKEVDCPPFMQSSHDALLVRIDEMQGFSQDFSVAVQMGDVLRLTSSVYRSDRINKLINQCDRNLDEDFTLQFQHAVDRLNGRVVAMRKELLSNIDILQKATA